MSHFKNALPFFWFLWDGQPRPLFAHKNLKPTEEHASALTKPASKQETVRLAFPVAVFCMNIRLCKILVNNHLLERMVEIKKKKKWKSWENISLHKKKIVQKHLFHSTVLPAFTAATDMWKQEVPFRASISKIRYALINLINFTLNKGN